MAWDADKLSAGWKKTNQPRQQVQMAGECSGKKGLFGLAGRRVAVERLTVDPGIAVGCYSSEKHRMIAACK